MPDVLPYGIRARMHRARSRVEQARRALLRTTPSWSRRPNDLPWFDLPHALDILPGANSEDAALLAKWVRDGYVVVENCLPARDVDAVVATLDGLWDASRPIPNLELLGLRETIDGEQRNLPHRALLALDPATKRRMREVSDWRIHGFHYVNGSARRIFWNRGLRAIASRIFGRPARPIAAINFMTGSEQELHQDMAVFHIYPHNYLMGAWIACEDIAQESGPLVFYPGSHRTPLFAGFTDYPQTNLRTADLAMSRQYQAYVDRLATQFERREFLARKGQVLFWHGMLIHGGAPVSRRGTSRKSMVLHYSVRGADRAREVRGPFNW